MNSFARDLSSALARRRGLRLSAAALSALLMSGSLSIAQTAAPATLPTTNPTPHSTKNITTQPGGLLLLNFRDANINNVLDELSMAAGFSVLGTRPSGRVNLISGQGVTPDGAIQLLNSVLKEKGYVALQQGKILKLKTTEEARHANIPVRTGSDPTKIDPTDELITQVIPLRYANATQLKQDLTPLVNPGADFTANASSNALLITDTAANIRRVCEIVTALDTHLADATEVRVFKLNNADATSAAKLVNDLFKTPAQQQQNQRGGGGFPGFRGFGGFGGFGGGGGGGGFRGFGGGGGGGGQPQGSQTGDSSAITSATVNASADDRTNTLVVTGPSDVLETVAKVVKELDDNPEAQESVHVFRLKNADAIDVQNTINALINGTSSGSSNSSSRVSSNRTSLSSGSSIGGSSSLGGSGSSFGGSSSSSRSGSSFGSTGTSRTGGSSVSSSSGSRGGSGSSNSGLLGLGGEVTIIGDADTNSMLVRCSPKNFDLIKPLLEDLDRPVAQVLIQVLIAEVTHDNSSDLGAEFSILNLRANGNGQNGGTQFGLPTGTAATGFTASIIETNFQATLRAYEENGKLDVLSRPYILASDNQLASVTVGATTPFVRNSQITEQGTINNTVSYADIGILLDVIPHINPDGLVTMDVAPSILDQQTTGVQITTSVTAPVFSKRSAETHVAVQDGQTIVIGGLMQDRKSETIRKVPVLGDIPIVGNLFRRQILDKTKTELLIFLTPHVAARADVLEGMGKDNLKHTKLVPGSVDAGVFQQHMEGMASGAATTNPSEPQAPVDNGDQLQQGNR